MKAEASGLSASRLARLDEVMRRRYVDSGHLPGLLTMVYRRGQLVHTGMSGQMDLERGKPMREDAIFRIYSMSKPITAVALMMLVEEGLIGLDDDVAPIFRRGRTSASTPAACRPCWPTAPPRFLTTPVRAADEGGRPGDPHLGPDLRLHDAHQRRSPPIAGPRSPIRQRRRARRDDRAARRPCRSISRRGRRGTIRSRST